LNPDMSKGPRPSCIGMLSGDKECQECEWKPECETTTKQLEADVMRGGTHVRITGKYKERKYKPKKMP
jgi:hypothetical protein